MKVLFYNAKNFDERFLNEANVGRIYNMLFKQIAICSGQVTRDVFLSFQS